MTDDQVRDAIRYGMPFYSKTSRGDILARYVPFGVVFQWKHHQMAPTPLQGSDLLWWLHAAGEEDDPG